MTNQAKKGYHQFRIEDESGNMEVTSKLSKKEFQEALKTRRLKTRNGFTPVYMSLPSIATLQVN